MFGRRKDKDAATTDDLDEVTTGGDADGSPDQARAGAENSVDTDDVDNADDADDADDVDDVEPLSPRPDGPWDISEAANLDGMLDLGSVLLRPAEQMELRVEVDQNSGQIVSVTCVTETGAVSVQAFAAPRSEGIWAEVRRDLKAQISSSGGLVDEVDGPWGREVLTQVPAQMPDGTQGAQPARFAGVDGPRWFLRLVFLGPAAVDRDAAAPLEAIVRDVVVSRDNEARAPGDMLPMRMPDMPSDDDAEQNPPSDDADGAVWNDDDLNPFERGPEITEIR